MSYTYFCAAPLQSPLGPEKGAQLLYMVSSMNPKNIPRKRFQTGNERPHLLEVLKVLIALDIVFDGVMESWKDLDVSR